MTLQVITENSTAQNYTEDEKFSGVEDSWMNEDSGSSQYGTSTTLAIGAGGSPPFVHFYRGIFRFDLSNIPAGATITQALFDIKFSSGFNGTNNNGFKIWACKRAWHQHQVTWDDYVTSTAWQSGGASGADDVVTTPYYDESLAAKDWSDDTWQEFDITQMIGQMHAGTIDDEGFVMGATSNPLDEEYGWFDSSNGTDGDRPELWVTYSEGGPLIQKRGGGVPHMLNHETFRSIF